MDDPAKTDNLGQSEEPVKSEEPGKTNLPPETTEPWVELNRIEDLKNYLAGNPDDTEANSYQIKLSGVDLSSPDGSGNTLKTLYESLIHYVALNLSDCTGVNIPSITGKSADNKANIVSLILPETVTSIGEARHHRLYRIKVRGDAQSGPL